MTGKEAAALMTELQPFLDDLRLQYPDLLRVTARPEYIFLSGQDGQGSGIPSVWLQFPDELSFLVADSAHEAAIEALWRVGASTSWPECPDHPRAHPLQVRQSDDGPVWACLAEDRIFGPIGSLGR